MIIHILQNEHFEDEAYIKTWADNRKHTIVRTNLFNNEELPDVDDYDMLIIMGGSMNVYEEKKYPFLKDEKKIIEKTIRSDKAVLGICLGSQLIADVLGSKVYKNKSKEIGWFDVQLTDIGKNLYMLDYFPDSFTVFHFHEDTFDIPKNAIHLAKSTACTNQAFMYNNIVIGLQFHLETTFESINKLFDNYKSELKESEFIQTKDFIISKKDKIVTTNKLMYKLMDNLVETYINKEE